MPSALTYPGVYIEEIPSGVRTIVGVATSVTAFIGRARRGECDAPIRVQGFGEYERKLGGLWAVSTMGYAVRQYFLNGGSDALIVRVHRNAAKSTITLASGGGALTLEAASEGLWGDNLRVVVDHDVKDPADTDSFNLVIEEVNPDTSAVVASEVYRNLSRDDLSPRFVTKVLKEESALVRVSGAVPGDRPDPSPLDASSRPIPQASNSDGDDGDPITDQEITEAPGLEGNRRGLWSLDKADLFNLLCIPPLERDVDVPAATTYSKALAYCKRRRAMLLVDPPTTWNTPDQAVAGVEALNLRDENSAVFFPRFRAPDPLQESRMEEFVPCGAVAGVFARTDAARGVWKAPAGIDATLVGVPELAYRMTDGENGVLNPLGVNCLRTFPVVGRVVWGARTLEGADRLASEWKYIPIRRLALFIEESLFRGTQWVVFEPNDEPLWAKVRLNVGVFMNQLFRQGAFQGSSPQEAYFVKCDAETTTQADRNLGVVNIVVGFAPLKPAEFVVIKIQQMAGDLK